MIEVVVKRDGRVVGFNEEKIKGAIRKAMLATEQGEDEGLIQKIADRIAMTSPQRMSVEDIQDRVELELMKSSRKDVAKQLHRLSRQAFHSPPCQDPRPLHGDHCRQEQRRHPREREHERRLSRRHDDEVRLRVH